SQSVHCVYRGQLWISRFAGQRRYLQRRIQRWRGVCYKDGNSANESLCGRDGRKRKHSEIRTENKGECASHGLPGSQKRRLRNWWNETREMDKRVTTTPTCLISVLSIRVVEATWLSFSATVASRTARLRLSWLQIDRVSYSSRSEIARRTMSFLSITGDSTRSDSSPPSSQTGRKGWPPSTLLP
ncbi:hypothetical protein PFISCL1PPCAC_21125, partial [Pristionchus fissidentatus]